MKHNTKKYQLGKDRMFKPRVYIKKTHNGKKLKPPWIVVKCGCCDEKLIICPGLEIEIGGILASKSEWWKILKPILGED